MSSIEDSLPDLGSLNDPLTLDKDTLLVLLRTSGLAELAVGNTVTTIYVDNTPKAEGELYLNAEGKPVYGFMTKFSETFEGWKLGDLVRARYIVNPRSEQLSLIVADSYIGDIRHADKFVLDGDQEALESLRNLGITELDLNLEITSSGGIYDYSNMYSYTARIDQINHILTAWDGQSELEPGQVLVQGKVTEYVARDDTETAYMTLDVAGSPVVINMNGGYVAYEGSPYEKLLNDAPEVGDLVQVLTSYNPNFQQSPHGRPRASAFDADWCRSTYCLGVHPERAARQEAFHKSVEIMIDRLEELSEPASFRRQYGKIIDLAFVNAKKSFIKDCRTADQQKRMSTLVDRLFTEDKMQKPLLAVSKDFPSIFSSCKEEFGIAIYSMSIEEAYEAVMEIAQDPTKLDPAIVGIDSIFRTVEGAISPEQMSDLATAVIETYYPITVRKGLSFEKKDYKSEAGKVPYNQHALTERAILYLGLNGRIEDTNTLMNLFENSAIHNQFSHKRGEEDYMNGIADSLWHALTKSCQWVDYAPSKVLDTSKVKHFSEKIIPRLITALGLYTSKVKAIGEVDGEHFAAIRHRQTLDKAQEIVELADTLHLQLSQ